MARMYEFVKQHVLSVLARGELLNSKSKEEANPRREGFRILEELGGTPSEQPISASRRDSGVESNRPLQTHVHAQPIISHSSDSSVPGLLSRGDSRLEFNRPLQPHPLSTSKRADHRPMVFIRSRLWFLSSVICCLWLAFAVYDILSVARIVNIIITLFSLLSFALYELVSIVQGTCGACILRVLHDSQEEAYYAVEMAKWWLFGKILQWCVKEPLIDSLTCPCAVICKFQSHEQFWPQYHLC